MAKLKVERIGSAVVIGCREIHEVELREIESPLAPMEGGGSSKPQRLGETRNHRSVRGASGTGKGMGASRKHPVSHA